MHDLLLNSEEMEQQNGEGKGVFRPSVLVPGYLMDEDTIWTEDQQRGVPNVQIAKLEMSVRAENALCRHISMKPGFVSGYELRLSDILKLSQEEIESLQMANRYEYT